MNPIQVLTQVIFFSVLLSSSFVHADENSIKPVVPKGQGEQCVAETEFMRRNHMDLLKHDRDLTMYHGLREIDFSLKGCIDCHVVKNDQGQAVTIKDEKHFCRTCHDFAAVTVDCFQCHASRPGNEPMAKLDMSKMPKDKVHNQLKTTGKEESKP